MVAYKDSSVDIETKYTVEVVDDKKDWDYMQWCIQSRRAVGEI